MPAPSGGSFPASAGTSLTDTVFKHHRTERSLLCSTNLAEEMSYRSSWEQSQGCMGRMQRLFDFCVLYYFITMPPPFWSWTRNSQGLGKPTGVPKHRFSG